MRAARVTAGLILGTIITTVLVATVASAGTIEDLDKAGGFGKIKLGAKLAAFDTDRFSPTRVEVRVPGCAGGARYEQSVEWFAELRLERVVYCFDEVDELTQIKAAFTSPDALKARAEELYGPPTRTEATLLSTEDNYWVASTVTLRLRISKHGSGELLYTPTPSTSFSQRSKSPAAATSRSSSSPCGPGKTWVSGYTKKNGTRVSGYCRG